MKNSDIDFRYKKINHLDSLLKKWIKIQNMYCKHYINDSLYWYNERADISVLAGSVWKCGEFCLEEFRTYKKTGEKSWTGRADLWFTWDKTEYQVESKHIEVSLSKKAKDSSENISKWLKITREEAVSSKERGRGIALGIVFVMPFIASSEAVNINSSLDMLLKEIKKVDYDFIAYTFPRYCRILKDNNNYIHPGIVLIGRVSKRKLRGH